MDGGGDSVGTAAGAGGSAWRAVLGRAAAAFSAGGGLGRRLEEERARWFVWLPVAFGSGIVAYFSLAAEPGGWTALALPAMAAGLLAASRAGGLAAVLAAALLAAALGFAVAKARTEWTRAPVLAHALNRAEILGVIELIEPRPTRGERLTLRVLDIEGLAPEARPVRVRVRVATSRPGLRPGDTVRLTASLRPPPLPALPGGYDFARTAWFQRLGGIGFAVRPAEAVAAPGVEAGLSTALQDRLERLRQAIGARILAALPGETGAIAHSLITGERGGITEATTAAYRDSGLVHILSISGLHMAIMAGAVFLAVRTGLAAFPAVALRFATKKWAAGAALAGALGYLLISGPSMATLRAFLMIAIMFVAVMLDRQALAMRNVAIAALIILALMPESLLDPGFQMSFAAVVSLIAVYEAVRERAGEAEERGLLRPVAFFLGGIVLSTVVASFAVAPFGAYHFHRTQQYGLIANLIAVPICNLIVMPAALLTLVAMPVGLEAMPLAVMGAGIDLMTATARWVAALPGAVAYIPEISDLGFALMVLGGLWLTLWQTRWRALGLAAIAAGVLAAGGGPRPDVLVGRGGSLVAVRGADGRLAVTGARGASFELARWLEHDGDGRPVRDVLRGRAFRCDGIGCTAMAKGLRVALTRRPAAFAEDCTRADILAAATSVPQGCTAPRLVIDRHALGRHGTHALYLAREAAGGETGIVRVETVAARRGTRPWTGRAEPRRRRPQGTGARRGGGEIDQ